MASLQGRSIIKANMRRSVERRSKTDRYSLEITYLGQKQSPKQSCGHLMVETNEYPVTREEADTF